MAGNTKPDNLGDFLYQARELAGLSKRELARTIGVDVAYIVRLERGERRNPSGEVLQGLADALVLDVNDLLGYVGVKPSYPEPVVYFRKVYGMTAKEAKEAAEQLDNRKQKSNENNK